ncbi:MAG: DHH family phosphoesterase [Saprospiraceae bacterium]|nr:DHH family phosphoesterase [Saprospiraceae bacterium]
MQGIDTVRTHLSQSRKILITSHRNPDGDAIGSSLAMYHWLVQKGHEVMMAFPSEYPAAYAWMPSIEKIEIWDIESDPVLLFMEKMDTSIILDYNSLTRIDKMGHALGTHEVFTMLIDHHLYPDPLGDFTLSDTTASSTCELVYRFIRAYDGDHYRSDLNISECIYTGILTDTGSFQYATSPALFRMVASLQEEGINNNLIQDAVFNTLDEKNLRLLGHCLSNRMEIWDEFHTGIIFLNKHDYQVFDIQRGDTEGIVNYLLKLKNIQVAAFIRQQPTIVKISLRSKGDFSVEEIAKNYFHGGGHRNASGGYAKRSLAATIDLFKSILPAYKDKIIKSTFS